ncbi:MAG TPA: trypsin-like peptidase domain-containing protein [Clostridiaceae bacterium]
MRQDTYETDHRSKWKKLFSIKKVDKNIKEDSKRIILSKSRVDEETNESNEDLEYVSYVRKKNKSKLKGLGKWSVFILIAIASGAITSFIITKESLKDIYISNPSNTTIGADNPVSKNVIAAVAEKVTPSVVGISSSDDNFDYNYRGYGSGIIYNSEGYILTNYDSIENYDKTKIVVKVSGSKVFKATLVGIDIPTDIAVLKIEANHLQVFTQGNSSVLRAGDTVVAIGNPNGDLLGAPVSDGVVSVPSRKTILEDSLSRANFVYNKLITTDARLNNLNNGGPLCNAIGEVIGINSPKIREKYALDMDYAISINEAVESANQLISKGKIQRPQLGIAGQTYKDNGFYVTSVNSNSEAFKVGIKPKDIIIKIDSIDVGKISDIDGIINTFKIGDKVVIKLLRDTKEIDVTVTLGVNK